MHCEAVYAPPAHTTIHPDVFHDRMRARWTTTLDNVYTEALGTQWRALCSAFNSHIAAHDDPTARERYTVVAAALGAGKTQGTILYCSMLAELFSDEEQPGVLVVTRRIEDANEIRREVNKLAGREDFAFAFHSEVIGNLAELARFPVLVVTHRGYQLALDKMAQQRDSRWPQFSRYRDGQRKLNVIDEAIDLVEHDDLTIEGLKRCLAFIPESIYQKHPEECRLLEETLAHLRGPDAFKIPDGKRAKLYESLKDGIPPDLSALRMEVTFTSFRAQRSARRHRVIVSGDTAKDHVQAVLQAVERVYRQWAYVAKLPTGEQQLHTARLILPRETKGAVILDATATANVLYRLFGDRVEILKLPESRSYRNLRLHVSRGHKTGKAFIVEEAEDVAGEIMANLSKHLQAGRKALLVTHKDAEATFAQYSPVFELHTAHWGHIDGSNDWRDCDAICIVSLPRRPDSWATSSYFAITGDVRDELLGNEGDQIRQEIKTGQVVSDVAQAVGRTRCRKVIDSEGNCDAVDVFLFLPETPEGDAIEDGIRRHFRGCKWSELRYEGVATKKKPKASKIEEAFLLCLRGLPEGTTTAKELRETSFRGCSRNSWKRITAALKDSSSELHRQMAALRVAFLPGSKGRGSGAAFVKQ